MSLTCQPALATPPPNWPWKVNNLCYPTIGNPAMVQRGQNFTIEFDMYGRGSGGAQPDVLAWDIQLRTADSIDPWRTRAPSVGLPAAQTRAVSQEWPAGSGPWAGKQVWRVTVTIPANTVPNLYDLEVSALNTSGQWIPGSPGTEVQMHSVQVVDSFKDNYSFCQLSDFHINDPRGPGDVLGVVPGPHPNWAEFDPYNANQPSPHFRFNSKAINDINLLRPDFVVMTGDQVFGCPFYTEPPFPVTGVTDYTGVESGYPPESFPWNGEFHWAYEHLRTLQVPIVLVPGNHDTYCIDYTNPDHLDQDGKILWPTYFGPLYFGWDYGAKAHFTNMWSYDKTAQNRAFTKIIYWIPPTDAGGKVDSVQRSWVQSDLSAHMSSNMRVMTCHHPFFGDNEGFSDATSRDILQGFSRTYDVRLALSGHTHDDAVNVDTTGGASVTHANSTTTSFGCNSYPGFRRITINNGAIQNLNYKPSVFSYPTYRNTVIARGKSAETMKAEVAGYNDPVVMGSFNTTNPNVNDKTFNLTSYLVDGDPPVTLSDTVVPFTMQKLTAAGHGYSVRNGTLVDQWVAENPDYTVVRARMNPIGPDQTVSTRVVAEPFIESIDPISGAPGDGTPGSGTLVTIDGESFGTTPGTVMFGTVPATEQTWGDTRITARVPRMGNGVVDLTVVNNVGTSNAKPFTVTGSTNPPHMDSLNPGEGVPGDEVTIAGNSFGTQTGSSKVFFGTTQATVTQWSDNQIKTLVPGILKGVVQVKVRNSVGDSDGTLPFTVRGPNLVQLEPATGTPGTQIKITGQDFLAQSGSSSVYFGTTQATVNSWATNEILAQVPPLPDGPTTVKVHNVTGDSNTLPFTVDSTIKPQISELEPGEGRTGTSVIIRGTSFGLYNGNNCKVFFGETQAEIVDWADVEIRTKVPAGLADGIIAVRVENANGASDPKDFTVNNANPPPFISYFSPEPVKTGDPVYIYGSNFGSVKGTSWVKVYTGAEPPQEWAVSSWSDTRIRITAPTEADTYDVKVHTDYGDSTNQLVVDTNPEPYISRVSPSAGGANREIAILGNYFGTQGSSSKVFFATSQASIVSWSATSITARVPEGLSAGTVSVKVRTAQGDSNTANFYVTGEDLPVITSLEPTSGVPGAQVIIEGRDFLERNSSSKVTIGSKAAEILSWSDREVVAKVPDLPPGAVNLVLCTDYGYSSATAFTVLEPPKPTWYLAEGTSDWGFDTYVTMENPNGSAVTAQVTYMTKTGAQTRPDISLPANSQTVVNPRNDIGVTDFSTKVTCKEGKTIAVDRRMIWQGPGAASTEGHSSVGVTAPAKTWYLPEGSSKWGFETWLLIQNPNATEATCTVTYMIEGQGPAPVSKTVPANSRASFNMADDIGEADASIKVESNVPVIPERAMYRNNRREGHDSIGTTTPAKDFYLAEGTTDWGFTTYVLVQNPNSGDNTVTITYMTSEGPVPTDPFTMPANSRKTINVNSVVPSKDLSIHVQGSQTLIAERAMYWDNGTGEACHDSIGMSTPHTTFYLPDGETSNGMETWTLVQNPNDSEVQVEISYLTPTGTGNVVRTYTIPANSRKSYNMTDEFGVGRAAIMARCKTSGKKIMVERAMYWSNRGAGTDTIGGYSD